MTLASSVKAMPGCYCLPAGQAAGYAAADAVQVRCSQPCLDVPCSICIAAAAGCIAAADAVQGRCSLPCHVMPCSICVTVAAADTVSFTCACTHYGRCYICLDVMMIAHISIIIQHACHMVLSAAAVTFILEVRSGTCAAVTASICVYSAHLTCTAFVDPSVTMLPDTLPPPLYMRMCCMYPDQSAIEDLYSSR